MKQMIHKLREKGNFEILKAEKNLEEEKSFDLEEESKLEEEACILNDALTQKTKRHRRAAKEIERNHVCPLSKLRPNTCNKEYGSEGSLN